MKRGWKVDGKDGSDKGKGGSFFRLIAPPFLKGQGPLDSHRPLCLFCCEEQRLRHYSGIKKDCHIAFLFCEIRDKLYLPF